MSDLSGISARDLRGRVTAAAVVLVMLVFGWFAVRWQIGSLFAVYSSPDQPNARGISEFAQSFSPSDPVVNWFAATVRKETFRPEDQAIAIGELQNSVRYAPFDSRYWTELARAYEQADRYTEAELALRQAVAVAPEYADVHWHLGNFLLRRGDYPRATESLRAAAMRSADYSDQVYGVLWSVFDGDGTKLEEIASANGDLRASLAKFYANKERAADSLRMWNQVPDEDKPRHVPIAGVLGQVLYEKKYYGAAVEFLRQTGREPLAQFEQVQNGGFEAPIVANPQDTFFGWQVIKRDKIDAAPDGMRRSEGNRSLRVGLNGFSGTEIKSIRQFVAVKPGQKYRLTFAFRTENLKSAGTPHVEVVSARDLKILATAPAMPSGTQDWTTQTFEFSVPTDSEGIIIQLDRAYCGDNCPIVGALWLDDFKLEKIN